MLFNSQILNPGSQGKSIMLWESGTESRQTLPSKNTRLPRSLALDYDSSIPNGAVWEMGNDLYCSIDYDVQRPGDYP